MYLVQRPIFKHSVSGVGNLPSHALTVIQRFKNAVLSRNLDQNMLKNAYFWKKQ